MAIKIVEELLNSASELPMPITIEIAWCMRRLVDPEFIASHYLLWLDVVDFLAKLTDHIRAYEMYKMNETAEIALVLATDDSWQDEIESEKPDEDLAILAVGEAWTSMLQNAEAYGRISFERSLERAFTKYNIYIGQDWDRKVDFLFCFCHLAMINIPLPA